MSTLKEFNSPLINILTKQNPYFKISSDEFKVFIDFENKFNSTYKYFYLNSYFLSQFYKHQENFNNTYSLKFSIDIKFYKDIHDMTILMLIFTDFEFLLKKLTFEFSSFSEKTFDLSSSTTVPYITIYLDFLQKKLNPNFQLSTNTFKFIDILRKIRNEYLHEGKSIISLSFRKELAILLNKNYDVTSIDDFFIEDTFKIIGEVVSSLQASYLLYHEKLQSH
jgi:hypothetical protein